MLKIDPIGSAKLFVVLLLLASAIMSCGQDPSFVQRSEEVSLNNSDDQLGNTDDLSAHRLRLRVPLFAPTDGAVIDISYLTRK